MENSVITKPLGASAAISGALFEDERLFKDSS
jgi:hypothetical protein